MKIKLLRIKTKNHNLKNKIQVDLQELQNSRLISHFHSFYNDESSGFGRRRAHSNFPASGSQNEVEFDADLQKIRECYRQLLGTVWEV